MVAIMPGAWRFYLLFGATAGLFVVALWAAFVLPQPLGWTVGFCYLAYDAWLSLSLVSATGKVLSQTPTPMTAQWRPTIAVCVASHNECSVLPATLAALQAQHDCPDAILILDDGSTDDTKAWLTTAYDIVWETTKGHSRRWPVLTVLGKDNSGKADTLNRALPTITTDIVVTIDADTVVAPGAIAAIRAAFACDPELDVGCGILIPTCRPGISGWLFATYQRLEYLRSFLWRLAWAKAGTLVLVSGALAAYRASLLREVGGFNGASMAEDYELLYRCQARRLAAGRALHVALISECVATTDVPADIPTLLRQRRRWFAGFIATLWHYRWMVGNPSCGPLGRVHLLIKTVDMLAPLYGLAAFILLIVLICGPGLDPAVIGALGGKMILDLYLSVWCIRRFIAWQQPASPHVWWWRGLLAATTETLCFQPLRHAGAVLGWWAWLTGRWRW